MSPRLPSFSTQKRIYRRSGNGSKVTSMSRWGDGRAPASPPASALGLESDGSPAIPGVDPPASSRQAGENGSPSQLVTRKKETQPEARRILGIGAVDRVVFDIGGPLLPDGAFFGVRGIGGTHQLAQIGDGMFF